MEQQNLLLEIQSAYNQFTKVEKKVADFVMRHPEQVIFMSITDLSEACKVADASVHRFCRTMKLKGYQEFKMKMSISLHMNQGAGEENSKGDSKENSVLKYAERIMNSNITALKETNALLNEEQLEKTLTLMQNARNVYFFGVGDSLLTAQEATNRFMRITRKVHCITDPHMQAMSAAMADADDLIIIISYSGATKDNIHVAQLAKEVGAGIVAITRFIKSPLTAYADAVLLSGSDEDPLDGGSMSTKLGQLYLVDILFREYYKRNETESVHNNHLSSGAVTDKLI